jgi:hypothetical protein
MMRCIASAALLLSALAFMGCANEARSYIEWCAQESARAERLQAEGARDQARASLEQIANREPPEDIARADARVLRQDAYLRWIELTSDPNAAITLADRALALGESDELSVAALHAARGRARERLVTSTSTEAERLAADRAATEDDLRAMQIYSRLLDRALDGEP